MLKPLVCASEGSALKPLATQQRGQRHRTAPSCLSAVELWLSSLVGRADLADEYQGYLEKVRGARDDLRRALVAADGRLRPCCLLAGLRGRNGSVGTR
jgi:hypothetical protein